MGKLIIHDPSIPAEQLATEREQAYLNLPPEEKRNQLMALIRLAVQLNGGKPIRQPQAKGLVISRKK